MKENTHSILVRLTACAFIVLILGSYFNFIYKGFGSTPPIWVSLLFQLGIFSTLAMAIAWVISYLAAVLRNLFK